MTAAILPIDLDALPAISPLAGKLLRLDIEAGDALDQLTLIVDSEPQLSARLVGLANSIAFASTGGRPIDNVSAALRRIGLRRAAQLSTGVLFGQPLSQALPAKTTIPLWLHALSMALGADEIARIKGLPLSVPAYLLGLFHDLGYLLIEFTRPGSLAALADATRSEHTDPVIAERRLFGSDHAELTRRLLEHWEVPDELTEPIHAHHRADPREDQLSALIAGAEWLARDRELVEALGRNHCHPFAMPVCDRADVEVLLHEKLGLTHGNIDDLVARTIGAVETLRECARMMALRG